MTHWRTSLLAIAGLVLGLAWYLYDPPWLAATTFGIREQPYDEAGIRFRWTQASASFYVPRDAQWMTLRLRPLLPGPSGRPVRVRVSVDGRWLADFHLERVEEWFASDLPLPRRPTWRSTRRVDLNIDRTVTERELGVQLADVELR